MLFVNWNNENHHRNENKVLGPLRVTREVYGPGGKCMVLLREVNGPLLLKLYGPRSHISDYRFVTVYISMMIVHVDDRLF